MVQYDVHPSIQCKVSGIEILFDPNHQSYYHLRQPTSTSQYHPYIYAKMSSQLIIRRSSPQCRRSLQCNAVYVMNSRHQRQRKLSNSGIVTLNSSSLHSIA
ncbi:hypothetical protein EYC80_004320 [Monilinia laxa]|uniref:Uncharacterized protein n=1 Tax=Monilinia laxa TaxID=61186 RepID=A0A5N6KMT8_MONLA|nr:hypothetical protein EYC80_004320 [Monilinia laxa]